VLLGPGGPAGERAEVALQAVDLPPELQDPDGQGGVGQAGQVLGGQLVDGGGQAGQGIAWPGDGTGRQAVPQPGRRRGRLAVRLPVGCRVECAFGSMAASYQASTQRQAPNRNCGQPLPSTPPGLAACGMGPNGPTHRAGRLRRARAAEGSPVTPAPDRTGPDPIGGWSPPTWGTRGSPPQEGEQLPGDLLGLLLGEEMAAGGDGLAADVVGVLAPDVEDGEAAGQAGVAPEGEHRHLEALAGGGAGLVGVQVVGKVAR
jgi:hypothetical protein